MSLPYGAKHLKDTGILQAYQALISYLMENGPPEGDALEYASKFVLNFESNIKIQKSRLTSETFEEKENVEDSEPVELKRERSKITLKTKPRVHPSSQNINPSVFETQERKRPLISAYRKQEIDYSYIDVFEGKRIAVDPLNRQATVDWENSREGYETVQENNYSSQADFRRNSREEQEIANYESKADLSIVNYEGQAEMGKPDSASSSRSEIATGLEKKRSQTSRVFQNISALEVIEKPSSAVRFEENESMNLYPELKKPNSGKSSKRDKS